MNEVQMKGPVLLKNKAKHLTPNQLIHPLETLSQKECDDIALMAAHTCQMPIALILLVDECRQWVKSIQGIKESQVIKDVAFYEHAIVDSNKPLIVEDATQDPRFAASPMVTREPNIRFYASMPIIDESDHALGFLCVMDYKPRPLNCKQLESLRLLSQSANQRSEERKQSLNLHAAINSFKQAVNASSIVSQTDKKGRITYVNDLFLEIAGYSRAELLGQDHRILNSGYHPREFFVDLWKTIAKGNTWRGEVKNKAKNGTYYWVDSVITPIKSETGKIEGYLSIRNQITKRKEAELQVQKNQQRYLEVINNINDGLLIDDLEGRVVFANKRLLEIFGITEQDLNNLMLEDYVAPNYQEILRDRHNRRISGEDVPEIFEYEGLRKDGTRRWFEARVTKIFENGVITGTQAAIRDITKRKKDEILLNKINQVVSVKTGTSYVSELTSFLCCQLKVKYAFVGKYIPEMDAIETISFRCDGKEQENFTYFLKGTPCDLVIKDSTCVYPSNVQHLFPEDDDLKTLKAESYLGIQLRGENSEVLGVIALLDVEPMQDADEKIKIISIAAPRTANEIKQRNFLTELKESENKYRNLFQKMNEGLVQTSLSGTIQLVNPRYAEITGYSEKELLGQNIYELLFNKERSTFLKGKTVHRGASVPEHYEEAFITKSGNTIWISISDSPQYNQEGEVIGITSIVSDITERKKAEEKITQSQQLLQNLTNQVPGAVYKFKMSPDGRMDFLYFSKGITKLCPGTTPESIQENAALIFESIHPEDRAMVKSSLKNTDQKLKKYSLQYRNIMPDGQVRWYAVNAVPKKQADGSVFWYGLFTDITVIKEMQRKAEKTSKNLQQQYFQIQELKEKYGDILHNTSDLIQTTDVHGIITFVNQAWLNKLGYASEDDVIGKSIFEFIHPECVLHCQQIYSKVLKEEQIDFAEICFKSTEGHKIDCEATITGKFVDGKTVHIEGFFRDVTELRKERLEKEKMQQNALALLEEKVQERTFELQLANKELETFNYTVSHDLQSPLRSISSFSGMLKKKYTELLDEEGKEYLDFIEGGAKRMSLLIKGLLRFSRLGKASVEKKDINMDEIVSFTVNEIKNNTNDFKANIILHPLRSIPCDAGLMRHVWANLIGNAVKYSSKKEKPVVEIGMQDINGQPAYFVKDNGDGFNMEYADKLFEVFQRLHHVNEFEGTGVGLATVNRIIAKHGGKIWAEGKKGQGAVFYFTLPG